MIKSKIYSITVEFNQGGIKTFCSIYAKDKKHAERQVQTKLFNMGGNKYLKNIKKITVKQEIKMQTVLKRTKRYKKIINFQLFY